MEKNVIRINTNEFRKTDLSGIEGIILHDDESNIKLKHAELDKKDSYKIIVDNGKVNIFGNTDSSIRYGLNDFLSLDNTQVTKIIEESPRYGHRELMIDVARHFFGIDEIKKIIDEMFINKINYLHLHLSDDQGFRIETENYPLLNQCEHFTKEEIKELVKYASIRNVEIIPEIDMPGHMNYVLSKYPNLKDEKTSLLSLNKKDTFEFFANLIGEISNLFPSNLFHIGADEYYGKNYEDVSIFINYICEFLKGFG